MNPEPAVEVRGVARRFGAVQALDGANLTALPGEVHALLGENGAGKSTLAHVLAGELLPDSGVVRVRGTEVHFRSPREAVEASIGIVHQHFKLVPALSGLENIALWSLAGPGRLDYDMVRERALQVAADVGLNVELDRPVGDLSVGARQRIEIVKLLFADPRILILDEPTAVLTPPEIADLFGSLRDLANEHRTVILIAHKLDEILEVADRVTVLRGGHTVLEAPRAEVDSSVLARAMVGQDVPVATQSVTTEPGPVIARAAGVFIGQGSSGAGVTLDVRRGEIVGIAGVEGNGQRELALLLAGLEQPVTGRLEIPGRVGFIPQDRGREGVVGDFTLTENVALAHRAEPDFRKGPLIRWDAVAQRTKTMLDRFDVRAQGAEAPARTLSGGNQQKLIVARELDRDPDLVVAQNPTRGLDIAASHFVRTELLGLRGREHAPGVVLISTDLDEVLELADRMFVLVRGQLIPVSDDARTREDVGALMLSAAE